MQRLKRLGKLARSQLLSASEIFPVDKLSAAIQDDNEFLREVQRRLQLAVQVLWVPLCGIRYSSVWRTSHTQQQQNARPISHSRYTVAELLSR